MTQHLQREVARRQRTRVGMKGLAVLDQRIQAIEDRLIVREEGLRQRVCSLRLRMVDEPLRLFGPVLGAAAALGGVLWLVRSRRRPRRASAQQSSAGKLATWVHYIGLVWPLLPAEWRSRIRFPWHHQADLRKADGQRPVPREMPEDGVSGTHPASLVSRT